MDYTIGFITLNNLDKFSEVQLFYFFALFSFALSISYQLFFKRVILSDSFFKYRDEKKTIDNFSIVLFLGLSLFLLVQVIHPKSLVAISLTSGLLFFLGLLLTLSSSSKKTLLNTKVITLLSVLALSTKFLLLCQNGYILIVLAIFFIWIYRLPSNNFFYLMVLIFCFKDFNFGSYLVTDTFHNAEHFVASAFLKKDFFSVFPNIGYLEELSPKLILKIFSFFGQESLAFSLATARSMIALASLAHIVYATKKKSTALALFTGFILPIDRISFLLVISVSICIVDFLKEKNWEFSKLAGAVFLLLLPLISLTLSPSYLLILIIPMVYFLDVSQKHKYFLLSCLVIWGLSLLVFWDYYIEYLKIYSQFSKLYLIGYATSIYSVHKYELLIRVLFFLYLSYIMFSCLNYKKINLRTFFQFLIVLLLMKQLINYGIGRVDPGLSRIIALGLGFMILFSYAFDRFIKSNVIVLLIISIFYFRPGMTATLHTENFSINNAKQNFIDFSPEIISHSNLINKFLNGRSVILYSDPAMYPLIDNVSIPPFTTPFVTLGNDNQFKVIQFFQNRPDSVIYLGTSFLTFDGVDIRARTPLIFKYISQNYIYENYDGNIFAIPKKMRNLSSKPVHSIFFNEIEIGKTPIYYANNYQSYKNSIKVYLDCNNQKPGRYQIISDGNTLHADLSCGNNLIPKVFLLGYFLGVKQD